MNSMARKGYAVEQGDALDFAVRSVVHGRDAEETNVVRLWGPLGSGRVWCRGRPCLRTQVELQMDPYLLRLRFSSKIWSYWLFN